MTVVDSLFEQGLTVPRDGNLDERGHGPLSSFQTHGVGRVAAPRRFLLVLGPFGTFTRTLAKALRASGALCERVLLNGGDLLDWGPTNARPYFGGLEGWTAWLEATIQRDGTTDLVIYGDVHPYCAVARAVGARLRLTIHVLEQGYFRPFWVTLERDGVNGASSLPSDPEVYKREAAAAPEPEDIWLPPLTPPAARRIAAYHAAQILLAPLFSGYRAPYPYPVLSQALGHTRRYLRQRLFRARAKRELTATLEMNGPLFLVILQRPGDSQLSVHSRFGRPGAFVEHVIASFAQHGPLDARLLFKSHPLDHGLEPHAKVIAATATRHGVADRVFFADSGDLAAMLKAAAGAITVNSTAGLTALENKIPTVVLGKAIYDIQGLTHQDGLDTLWTAPQAPDADLYDAFRRVVIHQTQVSGAYASRGGVALAAPRVARRLLES